LDFKWSFEIDTFISACFNSCQPMGLCLAQLCFRLTIESLIRSLMISASITSIKQPLEVETINRWQAFLSVSDQIKINRFSRWQDAQLTLLGRCLLMDAFIQLGFSPDLIKELKFSEFKKPFLQNGLKFNISHSGKYVICVVSDEEVGVDIEEIKAVNIHDFKNQWIEEEWLSIVNGSNVLEQFYRGWTRKEAIIKADGRGMMIALDEVRVLPSEFMLGSTKWFYTDVEIDDEYSCSVASKNKPNAKIALRKIDFSNHNLLFYERSRNYSF